MEELKDDAALWHESRNHEIQDYEEPAFIEPEPEPEEPKEYISDRDVKTELNMLKLNEPTAEIIVALMDYLMIIPLSFICRNISRADTKIEEEERDTLIKAWAAYLKTTSFNMSPGTVLIVTILTVYGAKVANFYINKREEKVEPEFIEDEKENRTDADNGKRITNKAKQIRKANPGKKWTTCMKEAGKALKGKL